MLSIPIRLPLLLIKVRNSALVNAMILLFTVAGRRFRYWRSLRAFLTPPLFSLPVLVRALLHTKAATIVPSVETASNLWLPGLSSRIAPSENFVAHSSPSHSRRYGSTNCLIYWVFATDPASCQGHAVFASGLTDGILSAVKGSTADSGTVITAIVSPIALKTSRA